MFWSFGGQSVFVPHEQTKGGPRIQALAISPSHAYTKEIQDTSGGDASSADQSNTQTNMQVTDVLAASHKTIALLQNHHMEMGKLLLGEKAIYSICCLKHRLIETLYI